MQVHEPLILGGAGHHEIGQKDTDRVNALSGAINQQIGVINMSYTIVKAKSQVVNGTNYFYHLRGNPHNTEVTVTIYEPLAGGNPTLSKLTQGHNALTHSHS